MWAASDSCRLTNSLFWAAAAHPPTSLRVIDWFKGALPATRLEHLLERANCPMDPSMRVPFHFRWGPGRIALAAAAALALLVWAFDWTWCRPLIRYCVAERSGRSIDFDELHVGLSRSFDPTVQFRGLLIQNAPWASSRPFVRAGIVSLTFSWRTILADQIVVNRLVLVDAEVDLERRADGLRNWRLIHPDDRGPPRIKVLAVDATRSEVRVVHRGIELDVDTRVSALEPAQALATHPELPLTKWLVFRGSLGGKTFEGQTALSDVLTFGDTPNQFAVRGKAQVGRTLVEAEGVASDIQSSASFDLDLRLSSSSLKELWPLPFADAIQELRPVVAEAHVNKTGSKWTVSRLRASVGRTDLAGELTFDDGHSAGRRPNYRATLRSAAFDINDVAPLMGMASSSTAKLVSTDHGLPRGNFDAERLRNFDAEVDLNILKLTRAALDLAQSLKMRATLQDGVLNLKPFDLVAIGGHVNGTLRFDGSRRPAEATLDLRAQGVRLDSLSSALPESRRLTGELDGRVAMHSQGESIAALVGAASGSLSAALINATISNRLDVQLGLNGAGLLRALFAGAKRVPVHCAIVAIDFVRGEGKTRHLAFETERTALVGSGSVSLAHESFDAVVMPQPGHGSLFVLNKAIHASGSFRAANVELVDPLERSAPDSCAFGSHSHVGQLAPIGLSERQSQAAMRRGSW
jgi:uncharacterized protein involved in outer membrane biogenesis